MRMGSSLLVGVCIAFIFVVGVEQASAARPASWKDIEHVVVVVLENTSYKQAMKQPYMLSLTQKGALLSQYYAVMHPSQPNYIALIGGTTFGLRTDKNVDIDAPHLGDLLESKGKTWGVYAEGYPGNCFLGLSRGRYVRKHVPFLSFKNVQINSQRCAMIESDASFKSDALSGNLPSVSFYIPDLDNDGHDTGTRYADNWLSHTFGPILSSADVMAKTLVVVTFDEDDMWNHNRVYTVLLGPGVKPGLTSTTTYDHYSLLRTIEEIFETGTLGKNDASAKTILDIWE
jgi:phospholipase C